MASLLLSFASEARAQFYPPAYPPPSGGYTYVGPESHLRLMITPREAMVYVDGYLAGTVDEFDGVFQRLHVAPGEHELVIYLQGYRTIKQHLYLGPNATRKITEKMEKLAAGEEAERRHSRSRPSTTAGSDGGGRPNIRGKSTSRSSCRHHHEPSGPPAESARRLFDPAYQPASARSNRW